MELEYTKLIEGEHGWVSRSRFLKIAVKNGFSLSLGERENATDGEAHLIIEGVKGTYDLHANYWQSNSKAWNDALKFILD